MFCSSGKDTLFPVKAKADWFDLITDWAESSTGCSFGQVQSNFGLLVFLRHSSARIWTKGLVCVPKIPCLHSPQLPAVKLLYSQHHKIAENFIRDFLLTFSYSCFMHYLENILKEKKLVYLRTLKFVKGTNIFVSPFPQDPQSPAGPLTSPQSSDKTKPEFTTFYSVLRISKDPHGKSSYRTSAHLCNSPL